MPRANHQLSGVDSPQWVALSIQGLERPNACAAGKVLGFREQAVQRERARAVGCNLDQHEEQGCVQGE